MGKTIPLKDLDVYKLSHEIGRCVSKIIEPWSFFHKNTLGNQFLRAADSIALNICEGYGRFHYRENKLFCYYSRGSLFETSECLVKAFERDLVSKSDYILMCSKLKLLKFRLNNYINSIGSEKGPSKSKQ
jgi:four helix bundle protein